MLSALRVDDFCAGLKNCGIYHSSGCFRCFCLWENTCPSSTPFLIVVSPLVFLVIVLVLDWHCLEGRSWISEFLSRFFLCCSLPLGRKLNNHRLDPIVGLFGRNCLNLSRLLLFFTSSWRLAELPVFVLCFVFASRGGWHWRDCTKKTGLTFNAGPYERDWIRTKLGG